MADNNEIFTPGVGTLSQQGTEKLLNMIFIVDTSGSMKKEHRIDAVNEAFVQMIPALRDIQLASIDEFELRISILAFDQDTRWLVKPTPIMEYNHNEIQCNDWRTYYSNAFRSLGEKLTKKEFMANRGKNAQPYIMFLTDGYPSSDDNYEPEIDNLLKNAWFTHSQRFAVLIGNDAIHNQEARRAVSRFVASEEEGIIDAADAAVIASEVQAITLHSITETIIGFTGLTEDDTSGDTGGDSGNIDNTGGVWDFGKNGDWSSDIFKDEDFQ